MGLKSFFQRKGQDEAAAPARSRRSSSAAAASGDLAEVVQQARTKARQRLIGALVLLGIGVIGFPLLFETQPRPIPVDLPIEVPRKDGAPALQMPAPRTPSAKTGTAAKPAASAQEIVETAADAGREVPPPASAPVAAAAPAAPEPKPAPKPQAAKPVTADKPAAAEKPHAADTHAAAAKPPAAADDGSRAKALLDGKPPAAAEGAGRFVVQVGAFSEVSAARETRLKVEKLGLKTYTQVVETDAGKRIRVRVGPFGSRDEADKAASKIKAAGLSSAVLTL
jgi:DedD protein